MATLATADGSFESRILDFSAGGAKVECAWPVKQGETVTVTVEPLGIYSGVVSWHGDGCFGMEFLAHSKITMDARDAIPPVVSQSLAIPTITAGTMVGGDPAFVGTRCAPVPVEDPKRRMSLETPALPDPSHGAASMVKAHLGAVDVPVTTAPSDPRKGGVRTRRAIAPRLVADGEKVLTLAAGEILFRNGDLGGRMYIVRSGSLCVRGDRAGFVEEVGTGGIVGEMGVVNGRLPRTATAVALTDCDLVEIDTKRFMMLIQQTPGFAVTVTRAFLRRLPQMRTDQRAC